MRVATAMNDLNWLGHDGGRLAMAFAAGCVATFGFMSAIGGFIWKIIGGHRKDRISELEQALHDERENCAAQLDALSARVKQLETMFTMHMGGQLALAAVGVPVGQDMRPVDDRTDSRK